MDNEADTELHDDREEQESGVMFDPAVVSRHSYLGEMDDVQTQQQCLPEGSRCSIPCISRPGLVVFPGVVFPFSPNHVAEALTLEKALSGAPQVKGMFVLRALIENNESPMSVGCLSTIRQIVRRTDGSLGGVIAEGRQRVNVLQEMRMIGPDMRPQHMAVVEILPHEIVPKLPREIHDGFSHWAPWAVRLFEPYTLAETAYAKAGKVLSVVKDLRDDPLAFSYWLAASLPIACTARQKLLTENCVSYRLRHELQLLSSLSSVYCIACHQTIANLTDVIAMSEVGPSNVFVNASGYVHDMMTVKKVWNVQLQGDPTVEHSWFPGYAWTLAHCSNCLEHVGWLYTSTDNLLIPRRFWGLSRTSITHQTQDPE